MRVTPNGDSIESFTVSGAGGVQFSPDVAFGGGNYMVVWSDGRSGTNTYSVYGARVAPSGVVLDANGIQIGPIDVIDGYPHHYPAVVFAGTRFFTIWGYNRNSPRIMGRFVGANGQLLSDTIMICTTGNKIFAACLAHDFTNFLVVWIDSSAVFSAKGQLIANDGSPIGGPFTIATSVSRYGLDVCFDGTSYLVTYASRQIWGRKYTTSGIPVGPAFRVSNSTNSQDHCRVVPGANNRYLNVWAEWRGHYDLYGNLDIPILNVKESNHLKGSKMFLRSSLVRDMITINGTEGTTTSIFDASGRKIGITNNGHFDCRHLEAGIYFMKTQSGATFKVIKIK